MYNFTIRLGLIIAGLIILHSFMHVKSEDSTELNQTDLENNKAKEVLEEGIQTLKSQDFNFAESSFRRLLQQFPQSKESKLADSLLSVIPSLTHKKNLEILDLLKQEQKEIKNFEGANCRGSFVSLDNESKMFNNWATLVRDYENNRCFAISSAANDLKRNLELLQVEEFPWIRDDFSKMIRKKLRKNGVKVRNQEENRTLVLVSDGFADDDMRRRYLRKLEDKLDSYRFRCIVFRNTNKIFKKVPINSFDDIILNPFDCILLDQLDEEGDRASNINEDLENSTKGFVLN